MKIYPSRSGLAAVSIAVVLILAACSSSTPTLRYITVSPQTSTIPATTTQQYSALAYYSDGTVKDGTGLVSWSSSDSTVATISAGGVATGVAPGTVTITGSAAGTSGASATLTVTNLDSVEIAPTAATIPLGATKAFTATGSYTNSDGSTGTSDVTTLVTWSSSDTDVATISTAGVATGAGTSGTSNITATFHGITSNTAVVTGAPPALVSLQIVPTTTTAPVGGAVNFTISEVLTDGSTRVPTGTVTWTNGTPAKASIVKTSANTFTASALAVGSTMFTASETGLDDVNSTLNVVQGVTNFAYVANVGTSPDDAGLGYFSVDVTSSTPLTNYQTATAFANTLGPIQAAVHPAGTLLYVVDIGSYLHIMTIDPATGTPTETTASAAAPVAAGTGGLNHIAIDPYGRFIYVSDDGANTIQGFTIDQTSTTNPGALTAIGTTTANLDGPEDLVIDPTGSYMYVTNSNADTVSAYSINQTTGALTALAVPTAPTGTTPYFETLDPSGAHLFVANSGDNTVSVFTLGAGGALGTATPFTVTDATSIANVAVAPSGSFIYIVDYGDGAGPGTVYAYSLTGATIGTTPIGSAPTGVAPISINIDATGAGLAITNNTDTGTLSLYKINSDGSLTATTPPDVTVGGAPWWTTTYNAAAAPSAAKKGAKSTKK